MCELKTGFETKLKNHLFRNHCKIAFNCYQCNWNTCCAIGVRNHYSGTHGKRLFICERCEYKEGHEKILKNHSLG